MLALLKKAAPYFKVPICLACSFILPFVALLFHSVLPDAVTNILFFSAQYVFLFNQVVRETEGGYSQLVSHNNALLFALSFWCIVSFLLGSVSKKWPLRFQWISAALVVIGMTALVHFVFSIFGFSLQLEGP